MARRSRVGSRGFTLIELLVAVGLMAVLAVLSWRGLETILQSRERLVSSSDELRALTQALSQLEEDLLHSAALRPLDLGEQELRIQLGGERQQQTLVLLREVNRLAMPTRLQRVLYEVRNGILVRGFSEWREPSPDNTENAGVGTIVWQPILAGVVEIRFRGWITDPNATTAFVTSSGSSGPGDGTRVWLDAISLGQQLEAIRIARAQVRAQEMARRLQAATSAAGAGTTGSAATAAGTTGLIPSRPGSSGLISPGTGATATDSAPIPLTGLAARRVTGLELVLLRTNGQRFARIYSAVD
jgi:type II secretion system protein J